MKEQPKGRSIIMLGRELDELLSFPDRKVEIDLRRGNG